ncbi:ribosomal protein L7/L12 [Glycomyces paridis]|uniref:Ribosomal protein L7/L12 n=2 Tax=Glycomyces paridis TaxID=2126555 RepID=A0A4S8PCP5_9ACTN|nr:ribosomal protein L7/L12 [Glycomyces paridis]
MPSVVLAGVDHGTASTAYRVLANAGATVRMTEAPAAMAPAGTPDGLATDAATGRFTVVMDDAGSKKIQVIKEIRAITGFGLAEAKRLADVTPSTVLSGVGHAAAAAAHGRLTAAGAVVRVAEA